jgi:hypothetical protein
MFPERRFVSDPVIIEIFGGPIGIWAQCTTTDVLYDLRIWAKIEKKAQYCMYHRKGWMIGRRWRSESGLVFTHMGAFAERGKALSFI